MSVAIPTVPPMTGPNKSPERMMGRFSKVIRNSPFQKLRKFLQNAPMMTLMAVSMAAVVRIFKLGKTVARRDCFIKKDLLFHP